MPPADPQNERLKALIREYRGCPESQAQKRAQIRLKFMLEMEPFFEERIRDIEKQRRSRQHKPWYLDIREEALSKFKGRFFKEEDTREVSSQPSETPVKKDFYGYDESAAFNSDVDQEKAVLNWFNLKLRGMTSDLYKSEKRRKDKEISEWQVGEDGKPQIIFNQISDEVVENSCLDSETAVAPQQMWAELVAWIKSDQCPPEILEPMKSQSTITGRDITLRRLNGQTWREMGQELRVNGQTLHSHYRRKCKHHLIEFWQEQKWKFED